MITLSVFARNQRPEHAISTWPEVGKGTREELDKGTHRRQLGKGDVSGESTPDSRSDQSAWESPVAVREDRSRLVGIPSSFVEISLEIHASVSLHMHMGNTMLHNSSLALWVNPSILFVCSLFFPPTPLTVFLVAMKKCVMPLSEPLVDHRPRSEMV